MPLSDIVCFSHLRWEFVYQRPNHLMARAARAHRVFFVEEPVIVGSKAGVETVRRDGLTIVRPVVPRDVSETDAVATRHEELSRYLQREIRRDAWLWYYTPMALRWTQPPPGSLVIYDCMDELSAFRSAPALLRELEDQLLRRADLVFTGGRSLYQVKRVRHPRTHLFPSSVDTAHFARARDPQPDPGDQAAIGRPRIGYFGVIDERLDLQLIADVAAARRDWHVVMVGPVTKVEPADLPRADNIHWLGLKRYQELPAYLAGWDVAIMPFAMNEATRYISPTKTPEYLAGGRPVVSTPVEDVARTWGDAGLVSIAADAGEFISAVEAALSCDRADLIARADRRLASQSWDRTWARMEQLVIAERVRKRAAAAAARALIALPDVAPSMVGHGVAVDEAAARERSRTGRALASHADVGTAAARVPELRQR